MSRTPRVLIIGDSTTVAIVDEQGGTPMTVHDEPPDSPGIALNPPRRGPFIRTIQRHPEIIAAMVGALAGVLVALILMWSISTIEIKMPIGGI